VHSSPRLTHELGLVLARPTDDCTSRESVGITCLHLEAYTQRATRGGPSSVHLYLRTLCGCARTACGMRTSASQHKDDAQSSAAKSSSKRQPPFRHTSHRHQSSPHISSPLVGRRAPAIRRTASHLKARTRLRSFARDCAASHERRSRSFAPAHAPAQLRTSARVQRDPARLSASPRSTRWPSRSSAWAPSVARASLAASRAVAARSPPPPPCRSPPRA